MEHEITPGPTALMSAAARAAHLRVDGTPPILADVQAAPLCIGASPSPLDFQLRAPAEPVLAAARLTAVARGRYAERLLADEGLTQHVVLGAGLDTSAHRVHEGVRTWLVDLPGVLAWRAAVFARAGTDERGVPVGVRLGDEPLAPALAEAGVDLNLPVQVSCLGAGDRRADVGDGARPHAAHTQGGQRRGGARKPPSAPASGGTRSAPQHS
jgi:O-methyltransferase involved in polyketide biosynthesis